MDKFKSLFEQYVLKNNIYIKINKKLDLADKYIIDKCYEGIMQYRFNRKLNRRVSCTLWFVGSAISAFFLTETYQLKQYYKTMGCNKMIDQSLEYVIGTSNNEHRQMEILESFIEKNLENDKIDMLGCLYLAKIMEEAGQIELSYQFYNQAHLADHTVIANNSALVFDIGKDQKEGNQPADINRIIEQLIG